MDKKLLTVFFAVLVVAVLAFGALAILYVVGADFDQKITGAAVNAQKPDTTAQEPSIEQILLDQQRQLEEAARVQQLETAKLQLEEQKKTAANMQAQLQDALAQIEALKMQNSDSTQTTDTETSDVNKLTFGDCQDDIRDIRDDLDTAISDYKKALNNYYAELQTYKNKLLALEAAEDRLSHVNSNNASELRDAQNAYNSAASDVDKADDRVSRKEDNINDEEKNIESIISDLYSLQKQCRVRSDVDFSLVNKNKECINLVNEAEDSINDAEKDDNKAADFLDKDIPKMRTDFDNKRTTLLTNTGLKDDTELADAADVVTESISNINDDFDSYSSDTKDLIDDADNFGKKVEKFCDMRVN